MNRALIVLIYRFKFAVGPESTSVGHDKRLFFVIEGIFQYVDGFVEFKVIIITTCTTC